MYACLFSSSANVLARESRMNAVHASGVLGWIKQADISFPHPQAGEPSVCGSFAQDFAGVGFPLNSDNWLVSENEVGKQSTADSGE
jgi:hypothetical protein